MSRLGERARRILTTHVGSLPRGDGLTGLLYAKQSKAGYDPAALAAATRAGVAAVVDRQIASGIDIVDDGEQSKTGFATYVTERLSGLEPIRPAPGGQRDTREIRAFPDFYRDGHSGSAPARLAVTGPIAYVGQVPLAADIDNLKAALAGRDPVDVFMPAVSPSSVAGLLENRHYGSEEALVFAIAEAMRTEYEAIVGAGFMLQVDDPRLVMHFMLHPEASLEECRRWAAMRIEALNHALRNIPIERIRHHTCYGINMGPRVSDMELKHLADLILGIRATYYLFEGANPRHEHEWRVWEAVKLPADKVLVPGVITHTSVLVEHPELVAERILRLARLVGRERVIGGGDCGFASTLHPDVPPEIESSIVWAKLASLVEGARLASAELWA
jgi:5-methyltetrahydropteroyltriglutamate--homocysteine methyltransferase